MRVAVYRDAERGREPADFSWVDDGEMVTLGIVCGDSLEHRETCGCGSAFTGIKSAKGCTVAVVEERGEEEALAALRGSALYVGWLEDPGMVAAIESDFRALSEELPPAGRVVRIRLSSNGFSVIERRPRRPARAGSSNR